MQTEFNAKTQRREGASRLSWSKTHSDSRGSMMRRRGFNSWSIAVVLFASLRLCAFASKWHSEYLRLTKDAWLLVEAKQRKSVQPFHLQTGFELLEQIVFRPVGHCVRRAMQRRVNLAVRQFLVVGTLIEQDHPTDAVVAPNDQCVSSRQTSRVPV